MYSFSQVLRGGAVSLETLARETLLSGVVKIFYILNFGVGGDKACKSSDERIKNVAECRNSY